MATSGSVGTAFITILPNTDKFVAALVAQMKGVSAAVDDAGNDAVRASGGFDTLGGAISSAGDEAIKTAASYVTVSAEVGNAGDQALGTSGNFSILGSAVGEAADDAMGAAASYVVAGNEVDEVGNQALETSATLTVLSSATSVAGTSATVAAGEYLTFGTSLNVAAAAADNLGGALAKRGAAGILGGPPGKGIATDVGSLFQFAAGAAQGFLGIITLIAPTINIIIAALIGVVSLLGTAVIAAAAFAAALAATAGAMALAAFKWRDLISEGVEGAETWQGAILAIEAEAFTMVQDLVAGFGAAGKAGTDFWTSVGEAGVEFLRKMQPVITWIVDHVTNFFDALSGKAGAESPFLDFMRTWLNEWKVLGNIINQGIEGGGGLLGFFEKYEKPAKAFVEGIAQVINGIRKMSALGLGLNMDQLAVLIRNVFTALAQLVQVFPKFSNSLVTVGLQLSEFLLKMLPIISASIEIGAAILQNIVAPLVNGLLWAMEKVMNAPFISWLFSLAGALAVVAFAMAKLSFNTVTFTQIMGFMITGLVKLVTQVGLTVLSFFELQAATISMFAPFAGGLVVIAALAAAYFLLKGPMNEVAEANKRVEEQIKKTNAELASGKTDGIEAVVDIYAKKAEEFNKLSFGGQFLWYAGHIFDVIGGMSETAIIGAESLDTLGESVYNLQQDLNADVTSGNLFDEDQLNMLASSKDDLAESAALWGQMTAGTIKYDQAFVDTTQALDSSGSLWTNTITNINKAFDDGTISVAQYAGYMDQLGITVDETGAKVNLTALKIKGASNSIIQALREVQKDSDVATGGLEKFADASGQSFLDLKSTALDAMTGTDGLLGTGKTVTEFFKDQAGVIEQWKVDTAEAFNFVNTAFAGLADGTAVSFEKIRSTLSDAIQDQIDYGKNWDLLVKQGASVELQHQVEELGQGGAEVLAGLVQGGRKGVEQVNRLIARGATLSEALAANMADTMGITMEKMTTAIEFMISRFLDIPFKKVAERVDHFMGGAKKNVDDTKDAIEKNKPKFDIDTRKAEHRLSAIVREGNNTKFKKPKLDIDPKRAEAQLAAIQQHVNHIDLKPPKLDVDTDRGQAQLAAIQQHGNDIDIKEPVVDVNTAPADAAIGNLNADLTALGNRTVYVHIQGTYTPPHKGPEVAAGGIIRGAAGFITQSPTYLVGEAHTPTPAGPGAEAVIPLNKRGQRIMRDTFGVAGDQEQTTSVGVSASGVEGKLKLTDWRNGLASLDAELAWEDEVRTR